MAAGGRPPHTPEQRAAAYERKKQHQRDARAAASAARIEAAVEAELQANPCVVQNDAFDVQLQLPWWALAPSTTSLLEVYEQPCSRGHVVFISMPHPHECRECCVAVDALCAQPPPACATPAACSDPDIDEYCDACWAVWEAPLHEFQAVQQMRLSADRAANHAAFVEARVRTNATVREERRRRGGEHAKVADDVKAIKRAARDAMRYKKDKAARLSRVVDWAAGSTRGVEDGAQTPTAAKALSADLNTAHEALHRSSEWHDVLRIMQSPLMSDLTDSDYCTLLDSEAERILGKRTRNAPTARRVRTQPGRGALAVRRNALCRTRRSGAPGPACDRHC